MKRFEVDVLLGGFPHFAWAIGLPDRSVEEIAPVLLRILSDNVLLGSLTLPSFVLRTPLMRKVPDQCPVRYAVVGDHKVESEDACSLSSNSYDTVAALGSRLTLRPGMSTCQHATPETIKADHVGCMNQEDRCTHSAGWWYVLPPARSFTDDMPVILTEYFPILAATIGSPCIVEENWGTGHCTYSASSLCS